MWLLSSKPTSASSCRPLDLLEEGHKMTGSCCCNQQTSRPCFVRNLDKFWKSQLETVVIYGFSLIYFLTNLLWCSIATFFFSGCDCSLRFKNLMSDIMKSPSLSEMYNSVRCEWQSSVFQQFAFDHICECCTGSYGRAENTIWPRKMMARTLSVKGLCCHIITLLHYKWKWNNPWMTACKMDDLMSSEVLIFIRFKIFVW